MLVNNGTTANQKTFVLNHESEYDKYTGTFTIKRLNVRENLAVNARAVQLSDGLHYDESRPGVGVDLSTWVTNRVYATLEKAIISAPPWFSLENTYDVSLLYALYQEVQDFENSFRRGATEERGGSHQAGQASSQGTGQQPHNLGHTASVVGGEVQDPIQSLLVP